MRNVAKPYKEKKKKKERITMVLTRTQQHITDKLTSQNQHCIVMLVPSYDPVL
jgi:hypothetical protein